MKTLLCAWMALTGTSLGLAGDAETLVGFMAKPTPWMLAPTGGVKKTATLVPAMNPSAPAQASGHQRFLQFAMQRRFPRQELGAQQRLEPTTLGLRVETRDGQPFVSTPVGLGLTHTEALSCLATVSKALRTNLDAFEFAYRKALVPQSCGGPGFTFAEAQQAALRLTLAGHKWQEPSHNWDLMGSGSAFYASLRVPNRDERAVGGAGPLSSSSHRSPADDYPTELSSMIGGWGLGTIDPKMFGRKGHGDLTAHPTVRSR